MPNTQSIGKVIRYHRKKAGLSQHELAKLAGVGKTAVFDVEKEKETIQLDTLRKILHALNITIRLDSPLMRNYYNEEEKEEENEEG